MSAGGATVRLYYADAYLKEFVAQVVRVADDGKRVYLDRTAFYPTSGGQPHDLGTLGGQRIIDVVDEDGHIAHVVDSASALTGEVNATIDWARRFDNMQQHTGQHLLSAVFEDLFGAKTVSVHFGDVTSTVDLETDSMSATSLEKAERRANVIIGENRPVTVSFEDSATVQGLRKAVDRTGTLRIITIGDLDRSACGGTHVRATGEIGGILLRGMERTKKAVRVEFVCGLRAVARARADHIALAAIATSLSTSLDAAAGQVTAVSAQFKESDQGRRRLERELAKYRSGELHAAAAPLADGTRMIVGTDTTESIDQLKTLAQALLERQRVVYVGRSGESQVLIAASEDSGYDAGKLLKEALGAVGGKGGGSPRLAQGSAPAGKAADAVEAIRGAIARGR